MSNLKRSIFWVAIYLACFFVLAQSDYSNSPIIDFAKYFYFLVLIAAPVTIFFPNISRYSPLIPIFLWGIIYLMVLQLVDRTNSAPNTAFSVVLLELVLLEIGVWLCYQLADGIGHAESIMDAMAISAFPNGVQELDQAAQQIKTEVNRSRRYHRPLGLLIFQAQVIEEINIKEIMLRTIQHDLWTRFSFARTAQIIDEHVRQTDIVLRERGSRFIVLCPDTDLVNVEVLGVRLASAITSRIGAKVSWGAVAFPDDALNFEDLIVAAKLKMSQEHKLDIDLINN